ncbi:hypothetical protein D050_4047 [Vibrio parahaemolyticus VPCR-2009]|nr:hypothetical protein D050_4047 [Vibrio parahaemolyticus VPCR-2009]
MVFSYVDFIGNLSPTIGWLSKKHVVCLKFERSSHGFSWRTSGNDELS